MKKVKLDNAKILEALDKQGKDWRVVLLSAGTSKNGYTYAPEILKKSVPLFEGVKAFAYNFGNVFKHLPNAIQNLVKEGFPHEIVGWYSNISFGDYTDKDGRVKQGICGDFHIN